MNIFKEAIGGNANDSAGSKCLFPVRVFGLHAFVGPSQQILETSFLKPVPNGINAFVSKIF